jgi:hypothetical protein
MLTVAPTQINPDGGASPYDHPDHAGKVSLMVGSFGKGNTFWTVHNGYAETVSAGYDGYGYAGYGYAGHLYEDYVSVGRYGEILSVAQETWDKPAVSVVQKAAPTPPPEPEPEPEPESDVLFENYGLYFIRQETGAGNELQGNTLIGVVAEDDLITQMPLLLPTYVQPGLGLDPEDLIASYIGGGSLPDGSLDYVKVRWCNHQFRVVNELVEEITFKIDAITDDGNVFPVSYGEYPVTYRWHAQTVANNPMPDPTDDAEYTLFSSRGSSTFVDSDEVALAADSAKFIKCTMGISGSASPIYKIFTSSGNNPIFEDDTDSYVSEWVQYFTFSWWLSSNPSNVTVVRFGLNLFGDS